MCVSKNCNDGDSSIRMVPLVSGVYPDVPPSGITLTVLRELLMATAFPPDWKRAFDGTIDIVIRYRSSGVCGIRTVEIFIQVNCTRSKTIFPKLHLLEFFFG